jgi:hypothetical protein
MAKGVRGAIGMKLEGADELQSSFDVLSNAVRFQVLQKAVRKAGRVMVAPLRRATPKSPQGSKSPKAPPSGGMRKSTGVIVRKYKGGTVADAYIGHRWPAGAAAHLIDAGTTERKTKKGFNRGRVIARRFFNPIYGSSKTQMESTLKHELIEGIERARQKGLMKAIKRMSAK